MIKIEDGWKFESTGREFYAYSECIGINKYMHISFGADGDIEPVDEAGNMQFDENLDVAVKPEEKKELALYMIDLWMKYAGITTICKSNNETLQDLERTERLITNPKYKTKPI